MSLPPRLIPIIYYQNSTDWFEQVRHMGMAIWLDSGHPKSSYGRFDIISAAPALTLKTQGDITVIQDEQNRSSSQENPFTLLAQYLPQHETSLSDIPFCGGALGYFAYDLGRRLETLPQLATSDVSVPDMHIGIYPWAIIQDHLNQKAWLVINERLSPAYNFLKIQLLCDHHAQNRRFHDLKQNLNKSEKAFKISKFDAKLNANEYYTAVKKISAYIEAGDCYQVNFAQRFSAHFEGDPYQAYKMLRDSLPSPFSAYMELEQGAILSLSPERFIKLSERQAETKPIKGTITRGKTAHEDEENAHALLTSTKDRAENVMIVDLLRNDLSKTCLNVRVPELFTLQSFANVHHLVSTVTGTLKPGKTALDLLANSFPGGSITGAPKIRAMQIIEELEPVRRSVYCGSLGYISTCGNMDTNIAIRTLICDSTRIHCWGGGGIVADSKIQQEYQESIAKIKLLLETLETSFGNKKST